MNAAALAGYLGPAALYGLAAAAALWGALRAAGMGVDGRHALTFALAGWFLALTQFPLPDPAMLDCAQGGVQPILQPFAIAEHFARIWRRSLHQGFSLNLWLGNLMVQAALLNFTLCLAIGAALARHLRGPRAGWTALAVAAVLSGGAELAQLTGLFGLYPCAWRTFEVDDLILNIGGLMAGFALMRARNGR